MAPGRAVSRFLGILSGSPAARWCVLQGGTWNEIPARNEIATSLVRSGRQRAVGDSPTCPLRILGRFVMNHDVNLKFYRPGAGRCRAPYDLKHAYQISRPNGRGLNFGLGRRRAGRGAPVRCAMPFTGDGLSSAAASSS